MPQQQVQIRLEVLDPLGQKVGSLISQDGVTIEVDGPIQGAHGFRYTPTGGALDKIPECTFTVPLHEQRNDALAAGNHVKIYENSIEMGEYVITTNSESLAANGREAQYTCPGLMDELRRITVSSGFIADIGHTNTGPQDPIATRPAETVLQVFTRLIQLRGLAVGPVTAWGVGDTTTIPVGLDGLEFGVYGVSVVEAIGQYCLGRFMHYKQGPGRSVSIGRYGQSSGLRLIRPSRTPYLTSENPEVRQITGFTRQWDGNYVNDIVPVGAGNGATILTLKPCYDANLSNNPIGGFSGFDARFPIQRRPRWDFGGIDGYEYYIDTANFSDSITRYGLSQNIYQQSAIGPTVPGNAQDLLLAASTLYQAAIAHLQWYHRPHETITVTTEGRGDLRDIAGKTVTYVWREINAAGETLRDVKKDYYVMQVERSWNDTGAASDAWTLSDIGRYNQDGFQVFSGALEQIDYFRTTPQIYPTRESIYYDCLVAAGNPASVYLDQDLSVVRMIEARFDVTCAPAVAPIQSTATSSTAGAHAHNIIGTLPTSGSTGFPIGHSAPGSQYGHGHNSATTQGASSITASAGQFSHAHGSSTVATGGGTVNNSGKLGGVPDHYHNMGIQGNRAAASLAVAVWVDNNHNFVYGAGATTVGSDNPHYAPNYLDATDHGHGSSVPTSGGGNVSGTNNGGFTPTTNGYGGFAPSVDQGATQGTGAGFAPVVNTHGIIPTFGATDVNPYIATAFTTSTDGAHYHQMAYGYYLDPVGTASGVTVSVNGTRIDAQFAGTGYAVGPYNGAFVIDLAAIGAIPTQGAVKIDFTSATFGRLIIRGKIRRHETTVAAHS